MLTDHAMTESEARERNGYLTTIGRVTGKEHEIEIWFAVEPESGGRSIYLLSGGRDRSDWVRNLASNRSVRFRAGGRTFQGTARIIAPDDPLDGRSREIVATKYGERSAAGELSDWARSSLPVVIALGDRTDGQP